MANVLTDSWVEMKVQLHRADELVALAAASRAPAVSAHAQGVAELLESFENPE